MKWIVPRQFRYNYSLGVITFIMIKKSIFTITILSLFISCSTLKSTSFKSSWLNGNWKGTGFQIDRDIDNTWDIVLQINSKEESYDISYPSIPCNGKWEIIEISAERAVFREHITDNNQCVSGGEVLISKLDNNRIIFSYYYAEGVYSGNEKANAFATLIKY